jgi:hypothetical protein
LGNGKWRAIDPISVLHAEIILEGGRWVVLPIAEEPLNSMFKVWLLDFSQDSADDLPIRINKTRCRHSRAKFEPFQIVNRPHPDGILSFVLGDEGADLVDVLGFV